MIRKPDFSLKLFGYVNNTQNSGVGNDLSAELKTFYDKALATCRKCYENDVWLILEL